MNIAVKFQKYNPNIPTGMPPDWPWICHEIGNSNVYSGSDSAPFVVMSQSDYQAYVTANEGAFAVYLRDHTPPHKAPYPSIPAINTASSSYILGQSLLNGVSFNIVFDGNSLAVPTSTVVATTMANASKPITTYDYVNTSTSGITTTQLSARAASTVDILLNTNVPVNRRIYIVWEITNELANGLSAATAYANIKSRCQAAKAAGWTKVIVGTCLPRSYGGLVAGFEANRLSVNSSILANAISEGWADAVAVVASDAHIGATQSCALDTTYYNNDGIHLNAIGQLVAAPYFTAALNSII